jgi:hypothetical protein
MNISPETSDSKLNRKKELLEQLKLLENEADEELKTEDIETENEADGLEKKIKEKEKKPRTAKQIEQFELVRRRKMEEARKRKEERDMKDMEYKKELEKKLIDKAIKIKKKQLKQIKVIEQLSDDETPVKPKVNNYVKPPQPIPLPPPRPINPYEEFKKKFNIK